LRAGRAGHGTPHRLRLSMKAFSTGFSGRNARRGDTLAIPSSTEWYAKRVLRAARLYGSRTSLAQERPASLRVFGCLPDIDTWGCTEAGVRKASREETAGEFAPTLDVGLWGFSAGVCRDLGVSNRDEAVDRATFWQPITRCRALSSRAPETCDARPLGRSASSIPKNLRRRGRITSCRRRPDRNPTASVPCADPEPIYGRSITASAAASPF
jgi:hypothetical protein